ncbi:MAG: dehydrogenase [Paenibacillus sp.]|jgi:predicted dehydrogenase|nr:dehydrogenase [Paenibacillus sp.]
MVATQFGRPDDLRIGIVGVGKVAMKNYLPWLAKQNGASLYYYSRTASSADEAVNRFGGYRTESLEELAGNHPDVIFILTNETSHVPIARELLKYGAKRLFIEKPLQATNGQANVTERDFFDARLLLREARDAGVEVAMNFNYRFFEQSLNLKRLIHERNLGQLLQSTWFVHYACWSHCIDLLRHFGGAVRSVSALNGERVHGTGNMGGTDIAAAFTMQTGAVGTIVGTSSSSFRLPLYHVTMNFEHGTVLFSDLDARLTLYREGASFSESFAILPDKSRWAQYDASFERSLEAYFLALRNGETPPVTGLDGLAELQFEAALRRSAASGRAVDLEAEFPLEGD